MTQSNRWIDSARHSVREAAEATGMVNVTVVARDVRVLHPNMPLLEIEQAVLAFADLMGVPIVFDGGKAAPPVPEHLIVEFIGIDGKEIGDAPAHAHSLDGLDKVASDI